MGDKGVRPKGRKSDIAEAEARYREGLTRYRRDYQRARTADERPDTDEVHNLYSALRKLGVSEREIRPITDEVRKTVERE